MRVDTEFGTIVLEGLCYKGHIKGNFDHKMLCNDSSNKASYFAIFIPFDWTAMRR